MVQIAYETICPFYCTLMPKKTDICLLPMYCAVYSQSDQFIGHKLSKKLDIDVHYNGIAVSNLVDGDVFFDGQGFENVTFTYPTRTNSIFQGDRGDI